MCLLNVIYNMINILVVTLFINSGNQQFFRLVLNLDSGPN